MQIRRQLERALASLERAQGGQTITYAGKTYPATVGTTARAQRVELGGWEPEMTLTVYVRKSIVPVLTSDSLSTATASMTSDAYLPNFHPGKTVTCQKRNWTIARVSEDATGAFWKLELVPPGR